MRVYISRLSKPGMAFTNKGLTEKFFRLIFGLDMGTFLSSVQAEIPRVAAAHTIRDAFKTVNDMMNNLDHKSVLTLLPNC